MELKRITKVYPGAGEPAHVLNNVDLRVSAGESLAIIGPSGCGKSTLLNIMGTLDGPTSGTVNFDGRNMLTLNDRERADFRNRSLGFVFQFHHLLPQCTALENVLVPTLVNRQTEHARARGTHLLDRVGLASRMHARPGELSGGECQRVAVARALINSPRLLLADEPTGSLSREGALDLTTLLLELNREEHITLVAVTHSLEVAEMMGSVLELKNGALIVRRGNAV
ncbi:MAG: ABC transporter ATP-binding protein [Candidatus Hydrogenedentes bacterium]|nr:ABC transporter ATP-binding protein [Candidatus Hydrogenedentota bacterium]